MGVVVYNLLVPQFAFSIIQHEINQQKSLPLPIIITFGSLVGPVVNFIRAKVMCTYMLCCSAKLCKNGQTRI